MNTSSAVMNLQPEISLLNNIIRDCKEIALEMDSLDDNKKNFSSLIPRIETLRTKIMGLSDSDICLKGIKTPLEQGLTMLKEDIRCFDRVIATVELQAEIFTTTKIYKIKKFSRFQRDLQKNAWIRILMLLILNRRRSTKILGKNIS